MSDLVLGRTQDLSLSLFAIGPTAAKSQCLTVAKVLPPSVHCGLWPVLLKYPQSTLPSSWTVCKWPSFSARRPALGSSPVAVLFLRSCATVLMATEKNNFSSLVLRGILKERSLVLPYSCTTYFFLICLPSPAFISSVTNRFVTMPWPKSFSTSWLFRCSQLPSLITSRLLGCICFLCLSRDPLELWFPGLPM